MDGQVRKRDCVGHCRSLTTSPPHHRTTASPHHRTTHHPNHPTHPTTVPPQLLGTPLLIVAGTDDEFVGMSEEAPRLKQVVDGDMAQAGINGAASGGIAAPTTIHWVEGAGHVSTLDDRCDLTVVMCRWIRR